VFKGLMDTFDISLNCLFLGFEEQPVLQS